MDSCRYRFEIHRYIACAADNDDVAEMGFPGEKTVDPSIERHDLDGNQAQEEETMSAAQVAELGGTDWTRVGPLRFPAWTSSGVLGAIPAILLATAVGGALAGERAALLTLTISLFALFLVVAIWVDTGRSVASVARAVLIAAVLAAAVGTALISVAVLSDRALEDNARSIGSRVDAMGQEEVDRADLVRNDLAGADVSGLRFDRRDMEEARLDGVIAIGTRFGGAWLRDASMRGAILTRAVLAGACLQGLDLNGATLAGADFSGADVGGVDVDPSQMAQAAEWPTSEESASSTACSESARP